MFSVFEASKVARQAFKKGGWVWYDTGGVPKSKDIAQEIIRQLEQHDTLRKGDNDPNFEVETSCGCLSVRTAREGNTDEVEVFLDLGSFFVDRNESILKTLAGDV